MPSALPPVTDCGCSSSGTGTSDGSSTNCCALYGVGNPNTVGLVPPDQDLWWSYWQLEDLVAGPPIQTWYWNPNVQIWQ